MSARPVGKLMPVGLPARIDGYFEANEGEELTHEDACTKFGCTKKQLTNALIRLRSLKRVEALHIVRRVVA